MTRSTDIAVIGAGPAGMAAAAAAAEAGLAATLLTEEPGLGGQIYRQIEAPIWAGPERDRLLGTAYGEGTAIVDRLRRSGAAIRFGARVWHVTPEAVHIVREGRLERLDARRILLAPGAYERPMPMRGWTLPSVMTVGAAQILLKQSGEHLPGDIVMAGAGPLLWLYADQLLRAGRRPAAIVLTAPRGNLAAAAGAAPLSLFSPETAKGLGWIARARAAGVPVLRAGRGLGVEAAGNRLRLRVAETGRRIEADWVLLHEGVIPRIQLPLAAGCALAWNEAGHYLAPLRDEFGRSSVGTIAVAGDGAGIVGAAAAAVDGEIAGLGLVLDLAPSEAMRSRLAGHVAARKRLVAARPLLDALYKPAPLGPRLEPDTILCRCEDVRAGEIARLMDGGLTDLNAVKSLCRAGMGPCQGQQCGISMFRMLRERRPDTPVSAYLRIRPPVAPIPLGALAGADPAELEGTA